MPTRARCHSAYSNSSGGTPCMTGRSIASNNWRRLMPRRRISRLFMVTGNTEITAAAVAREIGLEGPICPPGRIPDQVAPAEYAVFAGVFPEDKFKLVKAFQRSGHAVGMSGDGANDAPALQQAQMGI